MMCDEGAKGTRGGGGAVAEAPEKGEFWCTACHVLLFLCQLTLILFLFA